MEKWGKTSWAAQAKDVVFGMPAEETGLQTLIDSGQLPETPHLPPWSNWEDVLDSIDYLTDNEHTFKQFAMDTGNGCEKLLHDYICRRDYGGKYDKSGFLSYMQGFEASLPEWRVMLAKLDKLREVRKMRVVMLCHTRIKNFKNPAGADYDRYMPAMHEKTWEATHRWADVILFGNFYTATTTDGNRSKGVGGASRFLYTVRDAAYDAGNRLGLPGEIDCGNTPGQAWANFTKAVKDARASAAVPTAA